MVISGKFKLIEKIGQGSFGAIYKIQNVESAEIAAAKFEKREETKSVSNVSLLVREIKILMQLSGLQGSNFSSITL